MKKCWLASLQTTPRSEGGVACAAGAASASAAVAPARAILRFTPLVTGDLLVGAPAAEPPRVHTRRLALRPRLTTGLPLTPGFCQEDRRPTRPGRASPGRAGRRLYEPPPASGPETYGVPHSDSARECIAALTLPFPVARR